MKVEFSAVPKAFSGNVAVFVAADKQLLTAAAALDSAAGITGAIGASRFTGAKGQTLAVLGQPGLGRLLLLGVGKARDLDARTAENLGGMIAADANAAGQASVTVVVDAVKGTKLTPAQIAAHIALGARLRNYRFDKYKTKDKPEQKNSLASLTVVLAGPAEARRAYEKLEPVIDATFFTRDLVAEPANELYPVEFARRAKALTKLGVKVQILGEAEMTKLGLNVLLAVGQGSERESQLLVMTYMNGPKGQAPVALIGKGVCFDTGGISIKPAGGMEDMKWDMGGAGAVTGAMMLLAGRKAKANIVAVCALVENMPDGNATRPGDVVKSLSGQTVEIINTDAEGRLILCDAMWYCQEKFKPQAMIELSTLTGAIIVSLGHGPVLQQHAAFQQAARRGCAGRREAVAHAAGAELRQDDRLRDRRHEERQQRTRRRLDHRRAVPAALRAAGRRLGPSRHRRHGLVEQGQRHYAQGRHGLRCAPARSPDRGQLREVTDEWRP